MTSSGPSCGLPACVQENIADIAPREQTTVRRILRLSADRGGRFIVRLLAIVAALRKALGLSADLIAELAEMFGDFRTKLRHFLPKLLELVLNLVMQQRFAGRHTRFEARAQSGFDSPHVGAKRAERLGRENVH